MRQVVAADVSHESRRVPSPSPQRSTAVLQYIGYLMKPNAFTTARPRGTRDPAAPLDRDALLLGALK